MLNGAEIWNLDKRKIVEECLTIKEIEFQTGYKNDKKV